MKINKHLVVVSLIVLSLPFIAGLFTFNRASKSIKEELISLRVSNQALKDQIASAQSVSDALDIRPGDNSKDKVKKPEPRNDEFCEKSVNLACLTPRSDHVLKAVVVQYGNYLGPEELKAYGLTIIDRFKIATGGLVELRISDYISIPLPKHDITKIKKKVPWIKDKNRLNGLWYYYNSDLDVSSEIFEAALGSAISTQAKEADVIISFTEAQFEALGFQDERVLVVEQPSQIAWELKNNNEVEKNSKWYVADEIVHEIGHFMGLDHSSPQANEVDDDAIEEFYRVCSKSPNRNDIMSYCRDRDKVSASYAGKFSKCTRNFIDKVFLPVLSKGGYPTFQEEPCK